MAIKLKHSIASFYEIQLVRDFKPTHYLDVERVSAVIVAA